MKLTPRQYQADAVNYAMSHGINDRVLFSSPTGSGKTIIQALTAKREMDRGNRSAILTPRNEIFTQTRDWCHKICGYGDVSVLRAKRPGENWNPANPVHVVSWPTLIARARKSDFWFPNVRRLLVDEGHLSVAPQILKILERYAPHAVIDSYTATPGRLTGRGLGSFYTEIKHVTTVRQLIKEGWLAPLEYYGAATPDLSGIKIRRGDYEVGKLSKACVQLVGDAVDNWLRLAPDRHTITFAVDVAHAEALAERFCRVGISAAALHTRMDQSERDAVVAAFKARQVQVLVNVSIASYGFDAPSVDCVQICRPTKSLVLHLQMLGRGMRPAVDENEDVIKDPNDPRFKTCLVMDHANNVRTLGMADDLYRWTLDEGRQAATNWSRDPRSGEAEESKTHECEQCHHLFSKSRVCPKCGWKVPFTKRDVDTKDADLVEIGRNKVKRLPEGWPSHEVFYGMLRHYSLEKGYKPMWAVFKFEEKAKCRPPSEWNNHALVPCSDRIKNWIISRNIAYSKKRQKNSAAR